MSSSYNTSVELWKEARKSYPAHTLIIVCEGHVVAGSDGVVARFDDDAEAINVLEQAGFKREPAIRSIVFKP